MGCAPSSSSLDPADELTGVFNGGDKPIEPGMFVCNYSGEVVTDAESVARME